MNKPIISKPLYYQLLPNGKIKFIAEYIPFLTYLFALSGITLTLIKTPHCFERAFEMASPFVERALRHEMGSLRNICYDRASRHLAAGDMNNFVDDCQKGNCLAHFRKNIVSP